jgi:hemoglobin-like flavoprotein
MSPQQIELVQRSWAELVPGPEDTAALFYGRLFEIAPQTRSMFKGDLQTQGAKLAAVLSTVVANLTRLEQVLPVARQLAVRHVAWGVQPAHYDLVGEALLWALGRSIGSSFSNEMRTAWAKAYLLLAGEMKAAAYPAAPAAS